jgi:glycerol-3-phosphate dehydrogenase
VRADVVIIGAGIVGSTVARELSRYDVRTVVVEKEADVAFGSPTKANTGIIHAGYDDRPGTARAQHCARGNALWHEIVREVGAPFRETGSLVVAFGHEDSKHLRELMSRGKENGVPGLEIVEDRRLLFDIEPNLNRNITAALRAPTAGVTTPYELAIAMMESAVQNGVDVHFRTEVTGIDVENGAVRGVRTSGGNVEAGYVVNAAGLRADEVSSMAGVNRFRIRPRKGEYLVLDRKIGEVVRHVVFPTPTPISKGIVVAPTVEGNTLLGPNAQDVEDKEDTMTTAVGLAEVFNGAVRLVPSLREMKSAAITSFSGLRPEPDTDDFIIEAPEEANGLVNVAGTRSPALTAAPSIARTVIGLLESVGLEMRKKDAFDPRRRPIRKPLERLTADEVGAFMREDPRYGHVICRCEHVTEGEIVDAIRRGATTMDGIKFRTRAGMGRCQGGFCTPHVLRILASELGVEAEQVTKKGRGSRLLACKTKGMLARGDPNG